MSEQTGSYVPQPGEIRWVALECVGPDDDSIDWITINEVTGDIWQGIQVDFDHLAHDDATLLPVPPPGYRIVPADAVCITPEIAATLQEAVHNAAIDADEQAEKALMECLSPSEADEWRTAAESYRVAAASLRGGGNG